jgi:hypothetical protein
MWETYTFHMLAVNVSADGGSRSTFRKGREAIADLQIEYNPAHSGDDIMATKKPKKKAAAARKRKVKDLAPRNAASVKAGVRKAGEKPVEY